MKVKRRVCALVTSMLITTPLACVVVPAAAHDDGRHPHLAQQDSAHVVLAWERILMQTVYPATPIPTGVPLLGFTSMAMYDAAERSIEAGGSSETAAVARAAHDVLVHYFPAQATTLDAHLATSLAGIADPDEKARGSILGAAAANQMIASRVGDGYGDTTIHYTLPPGVGIWQPTDPATDMLGAWLGSLEPLVVDRPARLNGPDPLHSRRYATDYEEVRRLGGSIASGTDRTQAQSDTALFFNSNSAIMVSDALVRHLEEGDDLDLHDTALLFARIHAAMTDSVIETWRLKRDVGFWRPSQAIAGADQDGNSHTTVQLGWAPLIPNPPYSDYVSGHAGLTAPAVEVIRRTLGDQTHLELISVNSPIPRIYPTLTALEHDAFHARIWSGLHFRDAMEDGYRLGHRTARRVMAKIH